MLSVKRYRKVSTTDPPAVIVGLRNQDSLPIVALQIPHDVGLTPVPDTGRNSARKLFLHGDSNQRVSRSKDPRKDALDHAATVRDNAV